jgi:dinuclear metal center YbgI/SA1388 family protein
MTKIKEVCQFLEQWAPLGYQEDYDNAGLLIGDESTEITGILISLDITEAIVEEAINKGANMIVAHHPIIFKGLKKITGANYVERTVLKAIKNNIALYASHTNLDHVNTGVNFHFANKLGLENIEILVPKANSILKLTVFTPVENTIALQTALANAGAGHIGNYDSCSFSSTGEGSYRPLPGAQPTIGSINTIEKVAESKLEVIFPEPLKNKILAAMYEASIYEEVAYYLERLLNYNQTVGAGAIGYLPKAMSETDFLNHVKKSMSLEMIKYTPFPTKPIHKVAICGGAGSFLLAKAKSAGADAFITADYKYHEFFDAEGQILIADIGHYESEVATKELFHFQLSKKFSNFAILLSEISTNPVKIHI